MSMQFIQIFIIQNKQIQFKDIQMKVLFFIKNRGEGNAIMFTGVYPVYNIGFKIGTKGLASVVTDMETIADMESFSIKMAGKAETWIPMTTQGWERNLMTSKGFTITLKGKRNVGDPGNNYVASVAWQAGLNCSSMAEIDFPDGSKLNFNCVIDVTNPGGDSSEKVAPLEFDLKSDGAPTYTPATVSAS